MQLIEGEKCDRLLKQNVTIHVNKRKYTENKKVDKVDHNPYKVTVHAKPDLGSEVTKKKKHFINLRY